MTQANTPAIRGATVTQEDGGRLNAFATEFALGGESFTRGLLGIG
jgi:hypothetical protein